MGRCRHADAPAALPGLARVIGNGDKRSPVHECVAARAAGQRTRTAGGQRNGAELDTVDHAPGGVFPLVIAHRVEAGIGKGIEKLLLLEGAGDASAPEFRIALHVVADRAVADDVGYGNPPAGFQHPEDLADQLLFLFIGHQVEHAVGDDQVDGIIRDHRMLVPLAVLPLPERQVTGMAVDRVRFEVLRERVDIERQVLDTALVETDTVITEALRHLCLVAARQRKHLVVHIDTDHPALAADQLRRHVADLAATGAQVQDRVACAYVS